MSSLRRDAAEAREEGIGDSLKSRWASLVRRGPSITRRLRLASGLVLFSYVFLHFLNHSLGNISFEAMEWGGVLHEWIWRNPVGTVAFYGAFAIHFSARTPAHTTRSNCLPSISAMLRELNAASKWWARARFEPMNPVWPISAEGIITPAVALARYSVGRRQAQAQTRF